MQKDIRWKQRFENYGKALGHLQDALLAIEGDPGNHLYRMAAIGAFNMTFELGWKSQAIAAVTLIEAAFIDPFQRLHARLS